MKWEMEFEQIEVVLEKIWDLHDKLSDAIHAISRTHFLNSIKTLKRSDDVFISRNSEKKKPLNEAEDNRSGFVFVKDFRLDDDTMIAEAKSLNSIRTALENLEDQLEFFHTVKSQQQADRDAAIARLEQSRIVLAMRLADHHGKKYKVIEEALEFVGDVHKAGQFVSPENLFESPKSQPCINLEGHKGNNSNSLMQVFISSFNFTKKSLKLDQVSGILGNAALVAVSMLALLHLHQLSFRNNFILEVPQIHDDPFCGKRSEKKIYRMEGSSSSDLDVFSARG